METKKLKDEWQDIAAKTSDLLSGYISKFAHISEITLTWARPAQTNAPHVEDRILTVEEVSEPATTRNSGFSVKIVGIGSLESKPDCDSGQMGFALPKAGKRSRVVEQGPEDESRLRPC